MGLVFNIDAYFIVFKRIKVLLQISTLILFVLLFIIILF
jgi:hypothetical protein